MANRISFYRFRIAFMTAWLLLACQRLSDGKAFGQTSPFYKDKTIRMIVGFTPGGLYDQYARLLARNMGRHIPGNPNIIVQNMPGAGSLTATNYVYSVAKPDGLTLGMPAAAFIWTSCSAAKKRRSTCASSTGLAVSIKEIWCST